MKKYLTPDFDVTVYEISDEITASSGGFVTDGDPDEGVGEDWFE